MSQTVANLGEAGLLRLIQGYCAAGVVGDDAAVLEPPPGALVLSADLLVEGVHFSEQTTPPHSVGWRAAAANLSDLAAMGATPHSLVVGLGLPAQTPVAWVEQVYQGLRDCWDVPIVGGDLVRSAQRHLAITAVGGVERSRAIRRNQAQAGDYLLVSGSHGDSRAGLELLLQGQSEPASLIKAHQYPQPRLDLLPALAQVWHHADHIAGMDSSDGLADAVWQLCEQSGVGAIIETLPLSADLLATFPYQAEDWALYGGEDFQLVLAVPPQAVAPLLAAGCQIIGYCTATAGSIVTQRGTLNRAAAFQHYG